MRNKMEWNPPAAQSREELQDALFFAASGIKTQVLTSSVLGEDDLREFKSRLSDLADTVHGLQGKIRLGS
jgi:hypothetical protein